MAVTKMIAVKMIKSFDTARRQARRALIYQIYHNERLDLSRNLNTLLTLSTIGRSAIRAQRDGLSGPHTELLQIWYWVNRSRDFDVLIKQKLEEIWAERETTLPEVGGNIFPSDTHTDLMVLIIQVISCLKEAEMVMDQLRNEPGGLPDWLVGELERCELPEEGIWVTIKQEMGRMTEIATEYSSTLGILHEKVAPTMSEFPDSWLLAIHRNGRRRKLLGKQDRSAFLATSHWGILHQRLWGPSSPPIPPREVVS